MKGVLSIKLEWKAEAPCPKNAFYYRKALEEDFAIHKSFSTTSL